VAQPFVHRLRVRYAECDLQGVVFNANYMTYLDEAITELWRRKVAGGYEGMVARGSDMVVAEARLRFRSPARFDDQVEIEAQTTRLGTTGMTTELRIAREGETLVDAELRHVFVATDGSGKVAIPDEVRRGLEPGLRGAAATSR
jgi:acyl-CoA thioester hydrolase